MIFRAIQSNILYFNGKTDFECTFDKKFKYIFMYNLIISLYQSVRRKYNTNDSYIARELNKGGMSTKQSPLTV